MFRFKMRLISYIGLLLAAGLLSGGISSLGINSQNYKYNRDLDAWVRLYPVPANWFDARTQCHDHDAHLVSKINNEVRVALKRELFSQDFIYDVFTGVASSGSSCTALTPAGSLRTVDCNEKHPFFCYREPINKCGPKEKGYEFEARTGKCYKFHGMALTWRAALFSCHKEGGHLVIINSEVESTVLRGIFEKKRDTIFGSYDTKYAIVGFKKWDDGLWGTIHGDTLHEAGFSLWAAGEPNNEGGEEYCGSIFLQNGLYNDLGCKKPFAYICEIVP